MSEKRLTVDIAALQRGGVNLSRIAEIARGISNDLQHAVTTYGDAGGTGEMGESFQKNYKPGETEALEFLALLDKEVGEVGVRTTKTAREFEDTNQEASQSTPTD